MGINLTQKSSRLLQSRRYTTDALNSSQEAFTRVLDLGTSEIYSQTDLIPTSSLPFSGIGDDQQTSGVIKYWYRFQMTPDSSRQVWMFVDPPETTSGIQLLNPNQLTNFISPKYIRADLGDNNTELSSGTGYKVVVSLGSTRTGATPITDETSFTFDYKTGVLQFVSTPSAGNIYITAYQYIGRTLADNDSQGYSGSFSGSFEGDGAGLTNLPASSIVGLNLTQIADTTVSASVSAGNTSFQLISGSNTLFTINNDGAIIAPGTASFKDTTITGSLSVTQNLTVFGTASFTSVTSSELFVSGSRVLLHTNLPTVRFGGMEVIDDAATGTTGSLLWDSQNNKWIYANPSGTTYDGAGLMSGPRNTLGLGNETYPTKYSVLRGQGGDHLEDSNIYSTGSNVTINKGATGSLDGVELLGDLEVTGSVRITAGASGSFSGSFQGDGDGLTNIPANSIVGLNLTQIADSNISASVSSTGTPFSVKNNTIPLFDVNGLGGITTYSTSSLQDIDVTGSALVSGDITTQTSLTVSGSTILSGSLDIEGPVNTIGITTLTGSTLLSTPTVIAGTSSAVNGDYALSVSQSAWFYNHNAGVPRSNAWKSNLNGSYFNQFDSNTNVSEILRFIAGLLSASAPDASPNTKYYNSINNNSPSLTVGSIAGYVPQDISGSDLIYLNSKGFADTGSTIFNGVGTVYRTLNPTYNFTSVSNGTTIVSSSFDNQLFNLGGKGVVFNVSGTLNWRFDDNYSQTVTETSQSQAFASRSTFGSSNPGLTIGEINTVNPLVIPNAYQDGKFQNIFNMTFYNGGRSLTSVSSSGWYHISASIGIQSGSSVYSGFKNNYTKVFAAPTSNISIPPQTISFTQSFTPETATSRSLSGAPYLQTATWTYSVTSSGVFEPLYYGNSTIFNISDNSSLVGPTAGTTSQAMSGGNISGTSLVYDSTGVIQRSGIPFRTDRIQTTITETFSAGDSENINQIGLGTTSYTITSTSYNRSGTPSQTSSTIPFHEAGTFGQPSDSASMAYYGRGQTYDGGTYTRSSAGSLTVNFTGENRRLQIDDSVVSGSYSLGTAWDTSFGLYNLTGKDLQVKPNFLIKPGSTNYKYWIEDPDPTQTYKYYAVGFTRDIAGNQPNISMSLAGNTSLVNWVATGSSDTISALIIPQSVLGTTTTAAGIDPTAAATTLIPSGDTRNPFGRDLNILANGNTGKSNPFVIDFPTSPNPFPLNTTYRNFVLLIRYIGNPTPLTSVTFTITA